MQLEQEAGEAERVIDTLRERKLRAANRLAAPTAKPPEGAPKNIAKAINDKRDLVQEQLDKRLSRNACDTAEKLLDELEGMVAEADEVVKGVEVAKSLQTLSSEALKALSEVTPPTGYGKLRNSEIPTLLISAAAYKPLQDVASVIGRLNKGEKQPERSEIQNLISKAEALKNALMASRDEVLTELKDRAEQVQDQHDLVDEQIRKNGEMLEKLRDPSLLVDTLLKSWPKGVNRPRDLKGQLQALVDTTELEKTQVSVQGLVDTEWEAKPWTDANWLGNVMPEAQEFATDLRKALADMNVDAQEVVVKALETALVDVRNDETESKDAVTAAINGGQRREELAAQLKGVAKTVYAEIESEISRLRPKPNIRAQLELVNSKFLARETSLKEQQKKLVEEAQNAGVQKPEPDPTKHDGKQYTLLGTHGKNTVYARLDDCPTGAGMGAFMNLYKTALSKGIIPSSSTGSEGVKYESHLNGWVVKVTLRAVGHNPGFDNTWSPLATDNGSVAQVADPPAIYVNFDGWTQRH